MTNFDSLFKGSEKLGDGAYTVSSAKRATLIIPKGCKVFDEGTSTWYYGDSSTAGGIEFSDAGGFTIAGDVATTGTAVDWDLLDDSTSALSFDATGKAGILNIVTTNSGEKVTMAGALEVTGTETNTGAIYANGGVDRSAAAALAIGATNANAVNVSKSGVATTIKGTFNVDEAATFDTTVGVTGVFTANSPVIISGASLTSGIRFYGPTGVVNPSAAHASGVMVDASNFTSYLKCQLNGQTKYLWFSDVLPANMIHS